MDSVFNILRLFSIPLNPITLKIVLPVGISFYTFQAIGYVIDVYRKDILPERHFGRYAAFVSFFPQLVAGPIERSYNLLPQIKKEQVFDCDKALEGVVLMMWGYYKKLVIADNYCIYVDKIYNNLANCKGLDLCMAVLLFSFQIYCDFSGYSDIAIGSAKLLGIDLMKNFDCPYFASSVREFWKRWHISLSAWLRDYIYIPLGGSWCSEFRGKANLMMTFLISGLWHGADWKYVLWGGAHGMMQILEKLFENPLIAMRKSKIGHVFCVIFVFAFCSLGWVLFRADNIKEALLIYGMIFGNIGSSVYYSKSVIFSWKNVINLFGSLLPLLIYDFVCYSGKSVGLFQRNKTIKRLTVVTLGLAIVFASYKGSTAEFVYFQF